MGNTKIKNGITLAAATLGLAGTILLSGCADSRSTAQLKMGGQVRLESMGNGVCRDLRTGRMWQVGTSRTVHSLAEAKAYAAELDLGDYRDWRLPTVTELYDLYSIFDLHLNGDCVLQVEGTYWSDEPDQEGRVGTWELDDNCDPERQYIPRTRGKVRAVRP